MPTYFFEPPTTGEVPRNYIGPDGYAPPQRPAPALFRHIRRGAVGQTVLKAVGGTYTTVSYPTQSDCDAASIVYQGGHRYEVTITEKAALETAGYIVQTVP